MQTWEVQGGTLEFDADTHTYYYEGVEVPSVTQMLHKAFPRKYEGISQATLNAAADKGTALHEAIERYERTGETSPLKEFRNYLFLKRVNRFEACDNEIPIVIFIDGIARVAGRLDMVTEQDGGNGIEDIKRTATLDKEYLFYQLNWYRIGYMQETGIDIDYLKCLHLREDVRKRVDIPVNEEMAMQKLRELLEV